MTEHIEQLFEVPSFWSSASFGWTGGGIMPHFDTEGGVPRSKLGTFYADTVEHQGWHPLGAGELSEEWTVRGCESRAKLHAQRQEVLTQIATAIKKASTEQ